MDEVVNVPLDVSRQTDRRTKNDVWGAEGGSSPYASKHVAEV